VLETLTIITLGMLFLIFFRPGKTPPLENRLTIKRPGRYQITLAARLNLAQQFIEAIAEQMTLDNVEPLGRSILYFVVCDSQVTAHGAKEYLLAIYCRDGLFYFQAECPGSKNAGDYLDTIKAFTLDLLQDSPARNEQSESLETGIVLAVQKIALDKSVEVRLLTE
jgi:hypothetical protein